MNILHAELDVRTYNLMPCYIKSEKEEKKPKQIGKGKVKFH
jgi:hypothetical protein